MRLPFITRARPLPYLSQFRMPRQAVSRRAFDKLNRYNKFDPSFTRAARFLGVRPGWLNFCLRGRSLAGWLVISSQGDA